MSKNFVVINKVGLKIPKFTGEISDFNILKGKKIPKSYILSGSKEELKENTITIDCPYIKKYSRLQKDLLGKLICFDMIKYDSRNGTIDVIMGYNNHTIGLILIRALANERGEVFNADPTLKYLKTFGEDIIKILKKIKVNKGEILFSKNIEFIKVWDNITNIIDKKFLKICKGRCLIKFSIKWKIPKNIPAIFTYNGINYNIPVTTNTLLSNFESYNDNNFHRGFTLIKSKSKTCFQYSLSGKASNNLFTRTKQHIIGMINAKCDGFTNGILIVGVNGFTGKIEGISLKHNYNVKNEIITKLNEIATCVDSKKEFLELKNNNNITGSYYFIETIRLKKYKPEKVIVNKNEYIFPKDIYRINIDFNIKKNNNQISEKLNIKYTKNSRKNHLELRINRYHILNSSVEILKYYSIASDNMDIIDYIQKKYLPILNECMPLEISQIIVGYCGNLKEVIDFEKLIDSDKIISTDLVLLLGCVDKSGNSLLSKLLNELQYNIMYEIVSFYTYKIIDLFLKDYSYGDCHITQYIKNFTPEKYNKEAKLLLDKIYHR